MPDIEPGLMTRPNCVGVSVGTMVDGIVVGVIWPVGEEHANRRRIVHNGRTNDVILLSFIISSSRRNPIERTTGKKLKAYSRPGRS